MAKELTPMQKKDQENKRSEAMDKLITALNKNTKSQKDGSSSKQGEGNKRLSFGRAALNVAGGKALQGLLAPLKEMTDVFVKPVEETLKDIEKARGEDTREVVPEEDAPKVLPAEPEGDAQRIQSDEPKGAFIREGDNQEVVATKEGGEYLLLDIAANVETIANLMTKSAENQEAASREAVTDQNFEAEEAATATRLIPETGEPVEKGDDGDDGPGFLDKLKEKLGTVMSVGIGGLGAILATKFSPILKTITGMLGKTLSVLGNIISSPFKALGKILSTILRFLGPIGLAIGVGAAAFTGAKALLENTEVGKKIAGAASEGIGAVADFVKGEAPETKEQAEIKEGIQSKTMDVNELTIQRIGANENLTPEQKKSQVGLIQEYSKQQAQGDVAPMIQDAYHQIVETNAKAVPDITPDSKAAAIEPAPMATPQTQALTEESLKPEQSKAGDVAVSSTNIDTSSSSKQVIINQQPHVPVGF